jgi:hypothetical protein
MAMKWRIRIAPVLFAALTLLVAASSQPAAAQGCPPGTVKVGEHQETLPDGTTVINSLCQELAPPQPAPAATLKAGEPEFASDAFTPEQCQIAQRRIDAYREQLRQATETARRFNRTLAMDKALREEWENTMTAAVERAKARGQFLWLALPLGKLERVNAAAAAGLEKDGMNLADLLASTADPGRREQIRIARQFVAREKEIVGDLGKTYKQINKAQSLGRNALLVFEDPDESPTSPFGAAGMKLREAGEMLFDLMVERDQWKKLAANSALARHLASGLAVAFNAEAAARAMFDSWYDAFATGLAWEQLNNMNLNEERYLKAVEALREQMTAQAERLHGAEQQFAAECAKHR